MFMRCHSSGSSIHGPACRNGFECFASREYPDGECWNCLAQSNSQHSPLNPCESSSSLSGCPAGRFATHSDYNTALMWCASCETGKYKSVDERIIPTDQQQDYRVIREVPCKSCPVGKYLNKVSVNTSTPPSDIPPYFSPTSCIECERGKYKNKVDPSTQTSVSDCFFCPSGKYTSTVGESNCGACPSGKYNAKNGETLCIDCVSGKYNTLSNRINANACIDCKAGKYSDEKGFPSSYFFTDCDSSKKDCPVFTCKLCPKGKFQGTTGKTDCIDCKAGSEPDYSLLDPKSACRPCPAGEISREGEMCVGCLPGKYTVNKTTCKDCSAGKYKDKIGSSEACKNCPRGKYAYAVTTGLGMTVGQASCTTCMAGTYQSDVGQLHCIKCDTGKYSASTGAKSASSCIACARGKISDGNHSSCVEYDSCLSSICPAHSICTDKALGQCNCKPGFRNNVESNTCVACDFGKYTSSVGAVQCISCPLGKYKSNVGAGDCQVCGNGSNISSDLRKCTSCSMGSYFNEKSFTCTACSAGKYKSDTFSPVCIDCNAGKYHNLAGQSSATSCISCFAGSRTDKGTGKPSGTGSQACIACAAGYYSLSSNVYRCTECSIGLWKDQTGQSSMSSCISCVDKYKPFFCEKKRHGCMEPYPCQNGGICTSQGLQFTCKCKNGFTGATCTETVIPVPPAKISPSTTTTAPPATRKDTSLTVQKDTKRSSLCDLCINGECVEGKCNCFKGFTGANCEGKISGGFYRIKAITVGAIVSGLILFGAGVYCYVSYRIKKTESDMLKTIGGGRDGTTTAVTIGISIPTLNDDETSK
eukprot:g1055.t1